MAPDRKLPWEVFRLASSLLPHFDQVFEDSQLSPTDLFVLSHIKHFGSEHVSGQKILLKNEILDLLKRVYGYSATRATTIIKELHNEGLLISQELTEDQKQMYFGSSKGYKDAVLLSEKGVRELDEFNLSLDKLFDRLTAGMSQRKLKILSNALTYFSKYAYSKLNETTNNIPRSNARLN
jgi:hypothetical protein